MDFSQLKIERRNPRPVEYARLRELTGLPPVNSEKAEEGLQKSLFSVCLTVKGKTIACGRILGDGFLYFYIQDILVDPDFDSFGIDGMVMDVIMAYIKNQATTNSFVGVMAESGKEKFFAKYGFNARSSEAPGMSLLWK
jgi:hypothetical protein